MSRTRQITIIDILRPEDPLRVPAEWVIRIPVRAPVWTTSDGRRVRVRSDAYVDVVRLPSGVVEIRGAYALAMEPGATNSIQVYLRDTLEPATADDEDRPRPKLRPGQEQTR